MKVLLQLFVFLLSLKHRVFNFIVQLSYDLHQMLNFLALQLYLPVFELNEAVGNVVVGLQLFIVSSIDRILANFDYFELEVFVFDCLVFQFCIKLFDFPMVFFYLLFLGLVFCS